MTQKLGQTTHDSPNLDQIVPKKRRVIMQRDDIPNKNKDGQTILMRKGYIAVFAVDAIEFDESWFRFTAIDRLFEL
jgi:hypothetical protein